MLVTERERLREDIEACVAKHGAHRSALLPILQDIHRQSGQVSDFAMQVVSDLLDIHPVEVYGVVSFYSFLNHEVKGKFVIRLCKTLSCEMQGKDRVARQLKNDLGIDFGETTPDGKFTLEWASCLGMCDQGPAMLVNDQVFTGVTPEKVHAIIEGCRRVFKPYATSHKEEH
ncbi:MAG TPA: NAD(P)H-dependent oxidoreductase subunit E [Candidatus Hydrogenedentes bacterium]|nr:NAD(P)H-dependent oxidoreductase subunit E [Candidatus Hydrogenedentota bacterium]HPG67550.1 NAD(P)H-dependent oxidoreductase subunit E [Candidatus Hydrogenedentota bacterium]